jgi:hypothetical protein
MDQESELAKAKWLLGGILLFLVSGCFTYYEVNYWLRGTDGQATVLKVFESRGRRGRVSLTVEYEFTDAAGNRRKDQQSVSRDSDLPGTGGKIAIQYLPGADASSRLAGSNNYLFVGLFIVSLAFIAFGILKLVKEANDDGPKRRK